MDLMGICDEIKELQRSKNEDYGDTCEKLFKKYGIVYYQIMLDQKMSRLSSILQNGGCNHESLEDTLKDIAGYSIHAIKDLNEDKER